MSRVSIEVCLSPSADRGSLAAYYHLMVLELRTQIEDQIETVFGSMGSIPRQDRTDHH